MFLRVETLIRVVTLVLAFSALQCRTETGREPPGEKAGARRVRVAASIGPLADLARRVGGKELDVITLIPPGASEHTWEPAPRDAVRLAGVDLFFLVGLGFEAWASKLVGMERPRFLSVDASEGVDLIAGSEGGSPNPHYWLDPLSMRPGLRRLAQEMAALDPSGSDGYQRRAAATIADLEALDGEVRTRVSQFSSKRLVTFHAAWDYFARRYGLEVLAAIEESPGKEPGPRHLEMIVRLVREAKVRAVFAEPQFPPKAAEVVASECGVPVLVLDPLGGEGVPGRSDYFSLMRYNVGVMEEALR